MSLTPKSRTTSFLLTLFLGPLGLFYSSVAGGLALLIIAIVSIPTVIGPAICWILAIAIGDHCTRRHNQGLENLHSMMANK